MDDTISAVADHRCLFAIASEQQGYFTAKQATGCGFGGDLLTYHTRQGRFIRVHRGVYRLRDYPSSPREEVMAAWLAAGRDTAIVSHESALDLLDLSDIIPKAIHLTVPRSRRYLPNLPGVRIHTVTRPLTPSDLTVREGVRLTSAARTIADAAQAGAGPEQVELAVAQALERGLTTRKRLEQATSDRSQRVRRLIQQAITHQPQ
jgi:predicted transcriptional regulator of viral defense system